MCGISRMAAAFVGNWVIQEVQQPRPKIRYDNSERQPGQWITRESHSLLIVNGGLEDVYEVNVRTHWDLDISEERLAETVAGKIPVGTYLRGLGEIKGRAALVRDLGDSASNIFSVVENPELRRLGFQFPIDKPENNIYYINSRYTQILD